MTQSKFGKKGDPSSKNLPTCMNNLKKEAVEIVFREKSLEKIACYKSQKLFPFLSLKKVVDQRTELLLIIIA